jgi:hypothetical protein
VLNSIEKIDHPINNNMDFISPRIITSPISGQPVKPILKTYIREGKEIVEAHYIDPASGTFIRKGIVSMKDIPVPNK